MNKERAKKIVSLIKDTDKSYAEIGAEVGVSRATVNFWAKRMKDEGVEMTARTRGFKKLTVKELL